MIVMQFGWRFLCVKLTHLIMHIDNNIHPVSSERKKECCIFRCPSEWVVTIKELLDGVKFFDDSVMAYYIKEKRKCYEGEVCPILSRVVFICPVMYAIGSIIIVWNLV